MATKISDDRFASTLIKTDHYKTFEEKYNFKILFFRELKVKMKRVNRDRERSLYEKAIEEERVRSLERQKEKDKERREIVRETFGYFYRKQQVQGIWKDWGLEQNR